MIEAIRPCPRCGQGSEILSQEKIAELVKELPIDPSLAAGEKVYEKRLLACNECEALSEEVLCSYCGCFILFRARPSKSYCPHPKGDRWKGGGVNIIQGEMTS